MSLKAKNLPKGEGGNRVAQPNLEPGGYPARLVQVVDLGLQTNISKKYGDKPPCHKVAVTFELPTEFMVDEDGKQLKDKPRWVTTNFPLNWYGLRADKATSTKIYLALDPTMTKDRYDDADWADLLGNPCVVTIVNNPNKNDPTKMYDNVAAVNPPMRGFAVPELINEPRLFSLDEPDLESFLGLPQFIRDMIVSNLEFAGSKLQELLIDAKYFDEEPEQSDEAAEASDDNPY